MSKRSAFDVSGSGASNIRLDNVTTMWLEAGPRERYLLLEDPETGDVLMPLIYMKHILEANYSRKLASLKNRLVTVPPGHALHVQEGLLYWQWAFESPHSVKQIVRKEIGDATPQGHLRLVLLPIVYNALVTREDLRATPLFRALHRVMRASSYWPLLRLPSSDVMRQCDADTGIAHPFPNAFTQVLFAGPTSLDSTAIKYMFMFRSHEEMEASKRTRTTGIAAQDNGVLNATLARQPTHGSLPLMPSPSVAAMMGARAGSLGTFPDSATASDNNGIDNTTNTNNAGASNPNSNHDNHLAAGPGMDPDVSAMAPQQPPPVSQGFIDAIMGTSNAGGGVTRAALPPDLRMLVDAKFNDLLGEVNRLKMGMVQLYSVITNVASHHGAAAMAQSPAAAAVSPLLGLAAGLGPATAHAHNRAQHPQSSVLPSHKGDFHGGTPAAPPLLRSTAMAPTAITTTLPNWPGDSPPDAPAPPISQDLSLHLSSLLNGSQSLGGLMHSMNKSSQQPLAHEFFNQLLGSAGNGDGRFNKEPSQLSLKDVSDIGRDSASPPENGANGGRDPGDAPGDQRQLQGAPAATLNKSAEDGRLTMPSAPLAAAHAPDGVVTETTVVHGSNPPEPSQQESPEDQPPEETIMNVASMPQSMPAQAMA